MIFKSVQEVLFRTDPEGRLSFVNARWLSASGLPEAGALGQPLAALVRPESAAAATSLTGRMRSSAAASARPCAVR